MAKGKKTKPVDSAADGLFHGDERCGLCGEALDGQKWGTMTTEISKGWVHYICLVHWADKGGVA